MFDPVIKWSGSKRSQSEDIIKYFPKSIDTYYEPFCGGCSVLRRVFDSDISVNNYVCSDINNDLISLWNEVKNNPVLIYNHYKVLWNELNSDNNNIRRKEYFNNIKKRFNDEKSPLDFMFIMRTTTNGMPRYNKNGHFNNSFHFSRPGINPEKLLKIINEWSYYLNKFNVQFICCSYNDIIAKENDFMYLDPPYANSNEMYYGIFNHEDLWNWLRKTKAKYVLSFNGKSGNIDKTYDVPKDIYRDHKYIISGNSSFKRILGNSNNSIVSESLYIN
jgi:DNA adenine methylase